MSIDITPQRKLLFVWRWGRIRAVLREAVANFFRENSFAVSASIAYYSLLALFPMMLLLLGVSGAFIRRFELSGRLALVLEHYLPVRRDFIMTNLVSISRAYGRVSILSFLLLLWASSGVFLPLERAFNQAWGVEKRRPWWRRRLLALEMAGIFGILTLLSTLLVGTRRYADAWLRTWVEGPLVPLAQLFYRGVFMTATFAITLLMFLVIFERLPNRRLTLGQVFPGALLTALFWQAVRWLFFRLLPMFNYRQVYGSIGVVVALMTWVYISSAVMLFGAQVSRSLYRTWRAMEPGVGAATPDAGPGIQPTLREPEPQVRRSAPDSGPDGLIE